MSPAPKTEVTAIRSQGRMAVACAWCGRDLGWVAAHPTHSGETSHGICRRCSRCLERELRKARALEG